MTQVKVAQELIPQENAGGDVNTKRITLRKIIEDLNKGIVSAEKELQDALNDMNSGEGDIGPEKLLNVQKLTSIWTTYVSQSTTMAKAVADASKSIVRNYN